jgi:hypothetical protein
MRRSFNHLTATRGFALSPEDLTMLDYVHGAFFKLGPAINYAGFRRSGG